MKFKNKIKINMVYFALISIMGAAFIVLQLMGYMPEIFLSFGFGYLACGLVLLLKYGIIMSNPQKLEKVEIAANDERNKMIYDKAIRWTYIIYIYVIAAAIIGLELTKLHEAALAVSVCLCGLVLIYVVCYNIARRKY